jgi:hypothetical protein
MFSRLALQGGQAVGRDGLGGVKLFCDGNERSRGLDPA